MNARTWMDQRGTFCRLPKTILALPDLTPAAKLVLMAILDRVGKNESCWPSLSTLASDTGLSFNGVRKAVGQLVSGGYLTSVTRNGAVTTYQLPEESAPQSSAVDEQKSAPQSGSSAPQSSKGAPQNSAQARHRVARNQIQLTKPNNETQEPEIPDVLNTPEFLEAWAEWMAEKKERREKLTDRAKKMQLKKLSAVSPSVAVAAIEKSIERGWKSVDPGWLHQDQYEGAIDPKYLAVIPAKAAKKEELNELF